jgi:hypothetical protein
MKEAANRGGLSVAGGDLSANEPDANNALGLGLGLGNHGGRGTDFVQRAAAHAIEFLSRQFEFADFTIAQLVFLRSHLFSLLS